MRRREISASFWTDERVWDLESDAARLLLPALWQIADREGRLLDRPFDIGVQGRPWAPREVPALIDQVVSAGLLYRYEVAGVRCLAFPPKAWKKHQRPHPNERDSVLPEIPKELLQGDPHGAPRSYVGSTKVLPTSVRPSEPSGSSGPSEPSGSSGGAPTTKKPKKAKAAQAELPEIAPPPAPTPPPAPRPPTRIGRLHEFFQAERTFRFTDDPPDGLGLPPPPPDEAPKWGISASALPKWIALFPADWTEAEVDKGIQHVIGTWLKEPYWAEPTDKETGQPTTPYPWGAFITDKQFRKAFGIAFPELVPDAPKAGAA